MLLAGVQVICDGTLMQDCNVDTAVVYMVQRGRISLQGASHAQREDWKQWLPLNKGLGEGPACNYLWSGAGNGC